MTLLFTETAGSSELTSDGWVCALGFGVTNGSICQRSFIGAIELIEVPHFIAVEARTRLGGIWAVSLRMTADVVR